MKTPYPVWRSIYIVAAYDQSKLVGCLTLTYKPTNGVQLAKQYELIDVMVSEKARGHQLFVKLLKMAIDELQKTGSFLIYGTPNELAWPHEKRVGFQLLDTKK